MGDQSPGQGTVVVLYDDDSSKLYLHYFFHLVFGYRTRFVACALQSSEIDTNKTPPDLIVVNPNKFDAETLSTVKRLANWDSGPFVLCLKSEDDETLNETLFEAGAQEVLTLPLSLKELAYRLRTRANQIGLSFDFEPEQARTMDVAADIIRRAELTDIEAQVMLVLMEQGGQIVTRDTLSLAIDNKPWNYGNRKFDVHVARIRKKLDSAYGGDLTLRTVRSAGYQLTVSQEP